MSPPIKDRRKAIGWSRADLADRAGIDSRLVQLLELEQWSEAEALGRVEEVLTRAEAGEADVRLSQVVAEDGSQLFGEEGAKGLPEA